MLVFGVRSPNQAKTKAKNEGNFERIGRVVRVPAWKFGAAWAGVNVCLPRSAVLIGDMTAVNAKRPLDKYECTHARRRSLRFDAVRH